MTPNMSPLDAFAPPLLPQDLGTVADVAQAAGVRHDLAKKLVQSDVAAGYLGAPTTYRDGRGKLFVTQEGLDVYGDPSRYLTEHPKAYLVRVGLVQYVGDIDETRDFSGYHWAMTPQQRVLAMHRWWREANIDRWIGFPFVVALTGFIVEQGRIVGGERRAAGTIFEVDVTDEEVNNAWAGKRFVSKPGAIEQGLTPNQLIDNN